MDNLKRKLVECNKQIKELKRKRMKTINDMKKMRMNLVRDKKIKWVSMTFDQYNESEYTKLWLYTSDDMEKCGVWVALVDLTKEEDDHFHEYIRHYFYYGGPKYNIDEDEASECELAFENGAKIKVLNEITL